MKVKVAVLADYASTSDSKLNILGIFTTINALQEPIVHAQMKLVSQIEFNSSEAGEKRLKIALVDEDGIEMFSISGAVTIKRSPDGRPVLLNQILNLADVNFPKFGDYEFRLLLDDRTEAEIPVTVTKATVSPGENQAS